MKGATELFLETLLLSAINVFVVYTAAFNYKLSWVGVMTAMIVASLFTALIVHMFMSKSMGMVGHRGMGIDDGLATLLVAGGSSIAILVFLTQRFNFPEALGISLLAGGLSSFLRHFMGLYF